jgi:hypothetical protein
VRLPFNEATAGSGWLVYELEEPMRGTKSAVFGAMIVVAAATMSAAQTATPVTRREVRELKRDRHDLVGDKREAKSDLRDLRGDKRDLRQDIKNGNKHEAKLDAREVRADRVELKRDKREVVGDKHEIRRDIKRIKTP